MDPRSPHPAKLDLTDLLRLRSELGIVHQVPGRIRLRLGPGLLDWAQGRGLDAAQASGWLGALPGVRGLRVNLAAASLIIEYDPLRFDPAAWETLLRGEEDRALYLVSGLIGAE